MSLLKKDIRFKMKNAETLNNQEWCGLFNFKKIKTASSQKDGTNLNGFDLESAKKENPEHLFVKVFAIREDEVNDNADAFSADELRKAASSFVGVPIFTNHQNDDIEKARGKCVHAWYDEEKGGIYIISMIDKIAYAPLARGIEQGYIVGTSMGAISGDSEILMSDFSKKKISEIQVGEAVISHLNNICEVKETHSDFVDKDMLSFDLGNLATSPVFTPDHPIFSIKKEDVDDQKGNYKEWRNIQYDCKFREASELKVGDFLLIPSRYKLSDKNEFNLDF